MLVGRAGGRWVQSWAHLGHLDSKGAVGFIPWTPPGMRTPTLSVVVAVAVPDHPFHGEIPPDSNLSLPW